jgi:hypothetical protein
MNSELLQQRVINAQEQASEWMQRTWEEGFSGEMWKFDREHWTTFSAEDMIDLNKIPDFSLNRFWSSISEQSPWAES